MKLLAALWNSSNYWLLWLSLTVGLFLLREIWALASGRAQDTLSDHIWHWLNIRPGETIFQWSAGDLITFGVYATIFIFWLPFHFWGMRFR